MEAQKLMAISLRNETKKESEYQQKMLLAWVHPVSPVSILKYANARLSWEKPDHDGGSKITCYIVEMQTKEEEGWTTCSESRALEVTVTGLTRGKEYFFRVCAANEKGRSEPKSLLAPVIVKDNSTGPVINLLCNTFSVKAGNDLKIDVPFKGTPQPTVSWAKDGNMLKETSRVNVLTSDTSSQITIKDAARIDVGIYEVIVTNSVGTTSAEIIVNVFERPGPPCEFNVDEVSADFVTLSWQPPNYTGGCQISNYVVEKRDIGSTVWQTVSATVARTSIKISRLTQGTEYQFRIAAENRYGKSPFVESEPVVAQYPFKPPGPPTDLQVVNATKSVMVIAWSKPESDGGSPIIGYHIECKDQSSILWTKLNRSPMTITKMHTSLLIRECVRKDSGQYTLTVQNTGGTLSKVVTCKVLDRPGPPAGPLQVSGLSAEKCTLSWGPPLENGGAEIMNYIVEKCETSRVSWTLVYGDMMATTCKVTKLLKGNEYLFRVRAVNIYGEGETLESEPIKAMDPYTVPSAPTDVEVTSATADSMTICWKRPDSDGGSRISGYIIENREKQGIRWKRVNKKAVYDLRVKASGLHEGCEYEFRVFAENAAGLSEPSNPCPLTLAEDPKFLPSPPAKPTIIDSSKSSITLSWNKPLFDGGAAITGYKVEFRKSTEEDWTVGVNNTDKTDFTVNGLTSGIEYVFIVRSINKIGISEPSPETDAQVAMDREEEPRFDISPEMRKTLLVKDGGSFTLTLPFTGKPVPNVTWEKANVDLRVRGLINTTSSVTSITVEGATRDDSGKYMVKLRNVAGNASLTLNVRVLDSPGPPTHIVVKDVTKNSATVTWDIPENEGGAPVKNYYVDIRDISRTGWTRLTDKCHRLSYRVSDLEEGGIYFFRITGENEYGIGVPAETKEGTKMRGTI
uniref:Titin n=1 Tax=Sphaeramia orbicularis TaxID=375764 RepID=A0A673BZN9_9TELE